MQLKKKDGKIMEPVNLFYITAGSGHRSAAKALRESLEEREIPNVLLDILSFSNRLFKWTYSNGYEFASEHVQIALKGLYRLTDQDRDSSNLLQFLEEFNTRNVEGFTEYIRDNSSCHSICTHFFPAYVLSKLKSERIYKGKIYVTITDYGFHRMWCMEGIDRYFVASQIIKDGLMEMGTPEEKISLSGIPISRKFSEEKTAGEPLEKYGLDGNRFTLLFVTSSISDSLALRILDNLYLSDMELNVLVVTGRNRDLYSNLASYQSKNNISFRKFEFVDNMEELMSASDLMISKPGGLTVSEALACGLPLLMFRPIPYQETNNAAHVEEIGGGILANDEDEIMNVLEKLYFNPHLLETMRTSCLSHARPFASDTIIEEILEELN